MDGGGQDDVKQQGDVRSVLFQAGHQFSRVPVGEEPHGQVLDGGEGGALEPNLQVVDEGSVGPSPCGAQGHLRQPGQEDEADGQAQPACVQTLRSQDLVKEELSGQIGRRDRCDAASGQRQGDDGQSPPLAVRHQLEQAA